MGLDGAFKQFLHQVSPRSFGSSTKEFLYWTCAIDMAQLAFRKPPHVVSGRQFIDFVLVCARSLAKNAVPPSPESRTSQLPGAPLITLLFDDSRYVTPAKHLCQLRRTREKKHAPVETSYQQDTTYEILYRDWPAFMSDRVCRSRFMNWVANTLRDIAPSIRWGRIVVVDSVFNDCLNDDRVINDCLDDDDRTKMFSIPKGIGEADFKSHAVAIANVGGSDGIIVDSTDGDVILLELLRAGDRMKDGEFVSRFFIKGAASKKRVPQSKKEIETGIAEIHKNEADAREFQMLMDEMISKGFSRDEILGGADKLVSVPEFININTLFTDVCEKFKDIPYGLHNFVFVALLSGSDLVQMIDSNTDTFCSSTPNVGAPFLLKMWNQYHRQIGSIVQPLGEYAVDLNPRAAWALLRVAYAVKMNKHIRGGVWPPPSWSELMHVEQSKYKRRHFMNSVHSTLLIILAARFGLCYFLRGHLGVESAMDPCEIHKSTAKPLHAWERDQSNHCVLVSGRVHDESKLSQWAECSF